MRAPWTRVLAGLLSLGCQRWHRAEGAADESRRSREVTATVVSVNPSLESQLYVTVSLEFANAGPEPVTVHGYEIVWPGGRQRVDGLSLSLSAGQKITRTLRVGPASGSLEALRPPQTDVTWH